MSARDDLPALAELGRSITVDAEWQALIDEANIALDRIDLLMAAGTSLGRECDNLKQYAFDCDALIRELREEGP